VSGGGDFAGVLRGGDPAVGGCDWWRAGVVRQLDTLKA